MTVKFFAIGKEAGDNGHHISSELLLIESHWASGRRMMKAFSISILHFASALRIAERSALRETKNGSVFAP